MFWQFKAQTFTIISLSISAGLCLLFLAKYNGVTVIFFGVRFSANQYTARIEETDKCDHPVTINIIYTYFMLKVTFIHVEHYTK